MPIKSVPRKFSDHYLQEAHMVTVDFQQILTAARQLPKPSQAKLVSALLQEHSRHPPLL
jgi:hypothetical protein